MAEAMSDERLGADLDAAELLAVARAHHAAYVQSHSHAGAFACCSAHTSADDVPELVAEVERLRSLEQSYIVALDQANIGDMQRLAQRVETAECELAEVRDELAETRASQNPLLRCLIIKAAPDRDLYIGWSNVVEAPTGIWTRAEAEAYGFPRSRLDRADRNGTSSMVPGSGQWDDIGFIAEQRGWLRRDRIGDYAQAYAREDYDAAWDLLEPFEGETEVRRG